MTTNRPSSGLTLFCFSFALATLSRASPRYLSTDVSEKQIEPIAVPLFVDRSSTSGISDRSRYKYGGPMIADLDGDGWDDITLGEHENGNARVYLRVSGRSFTLAYDHPPRIDYHGMAAYSLDGTDSLDVIMNQGGVNGRVLSTPDVFKYIPAEKTFERRPSSAFGLDLFVTRGRAVLLIDVDLDGDDDMVLTGRTVGTPDQLSEMAVLESDGDGGWTVYDDLSVKNALCFTAILTIDLDDDAIMDLVCTEAGEPDGGQFSILRGTGTFPEPFEDVTNQWLGSSMLGVFWGFYDYMTDLDYDNDGRMDVYVTCGLNFTLDECNDVLLRNTGTEFEDVSREAGIPIGGVHQEPAAGDFNLDGYIDLFIPSYGSGSGPASNILLMNRGDGTFETITDHGVNVAAPTTFRGAGAGALLMNFGGRLDLIVGYEGVDGGGPYKFYKNRTPKNGMNFLALKVNDIPSSNLIARGAKVTIRIGETIMIRRVGSAGGESQSFQRRVHFGIGNATSVDSVVIEYLGGTTRTKLNLRSGFRQGNRS